ncbi:putative membrane protein YgcG [Rhizomicrobium palustre]|uniref:Putative membrane protein YgcG n=1 Tax=Rhizomicrobium palustre TaxID=189966 RepID=A0A846MVI7_9PROT|nr:hypothetical protein [Rhizomicrobium palustre]NIK87229.1 putative membrane protein YgcG [Rhizomicrobium palustre]
MKVFGKAVFAAMLLMGTAGLTAAPAKAEFAIGFSFGYDGGYFSDPCDYYDYYDVAPPWGLPPDYCEYPVYSEPVYFGGSWYRGPIYYRWYGGDRLYWLNGGWRRDEWRGARPSIRWTDRGGWHARRDWNNRGWGDFRHDDRGSWGRGNWDRGDWNRGGDRNAWNRGDWNRGGDWNRERGNWDRGADRGDWNRGNWNRGAQPNGGQGGWGGRAQFSGGQPGGSWGGRGGGQSGGGWGGRGPGGGGPGGGGRGGDHHGH